MVKEIFEHKTIRKYKEQQIPENILNEILTAAIRASNTGNMQVYSIIATTDNEIKKQLAPAHFNQLMVTEAPVVLTFCADFNRFNLWCKFRNAEPCYDNFLSFMTAATDAIIAAQNACLEAENHGIGICYLGTAIYNADKIIETLKLPIGVVPVAVVTMGYPCENPELLDRLPLEAVVHKETYKNYTEDDINRLYAEKENRDDSKQFIFENNKQTLAQVFTDVRYPKNNNEYFSDVLLKVLKQQKFL
ncbi:MAG: nitroreductase family protein [Bacteroidales bacterium]|jgi:nitroreductase|nr:nitroreductase family protein [Bacteroidales bacterium]